MNKYKIPVVRKMTETLEIEARNEDEAVQKAEESMATSLCVHCAKTREVEDDIYEVLDSEIELVEGEEEDEDEEE